MTDGLTPICVFKTQDSIFQGSNFKIQNSSSNFYKKLLSYIKTVIFFTVFFVYIKKNSYLCYTKKIKYA